MGLKVRIGQILLMFSWEKMMAYGKGVLETDKSPMSLVDGPQVIETST